jgi:sugar lactone lactonase YvrE
LIAGRSGLIQRQQSDGSFATHVDLATLSDKPWNNMVVDGRGNMYIGNIGFDFPGGEFRPGLIAVVRPDGFARQVADETAFANGMVVTPTTRRSSLPKPTPTDLRHSTSAPTAACRTVASGQRSLTASLTASR